jgi:5-methylcytosine-specific restriction endonuclease McrA
MRALERDGARCACCGRTPADGVRINVDHIKPRHRYPELALTLENLQVLCHECNHGKGNLFETNWRGNRATGTTAEEAERMRQLAEIRRMAR